VAGRAVVPVRGDNHYLTDPLQGLGENGKARGTNPVIVGYQYQWGHFSPPRFSPNLAIF
jgi:hypothetical protein